MQSHGPQATSACGAPRPAGQATAFAVGADGTCRPVPRPWVKAAAQRPADSTSKGMNTGKDKGTGVGKDKGKDTRLPMLDGEGDMWGWGPRPYEFGKNGRRGVNPYPAAFEAMGTGKGKQGDPAGKGKSQDITEPKPHPNAD